jgi:hypothetical protein
MVHKNARANITYVHLDIMRHWCDSKFGPPPCKKLLIVKGLVLVPQHFLKHAFIPPQLVCLHGFYMDGIIFYDTQIKNVLLQKWGAVH